MRNSPSFPGGGIPKLLRAWQQGMTGIPLVDAGMRELWATGWMHNRVRMVVASFLVKNLLIAWQDGARWFWDTLVDADLANNTLNWQWSAGCGADAAPYFRIFNPQTQAKRFDPKNDYIRKWIPRDGYPRPIGDLTKTRETALDAYVTMRRAASAATPHRTYRGLTVAVNTVLNEINQLAPDVPQLVRVTLRLLAALFIGTAIGLQRELTHKPAGLRTHMLVALGTALFIVGAAESGMPPGLTVADRAGHSRPESGFWAAARFSSSPPSAKSTDSRPQQASG